MIIPVTAPITISGCVVAEVDARIVAEPSSNDPNDGFDVTAVEVKCLDGVWRAAILELSRQIINAITDDEIFEALRTDGAWPSRDELRRQAPLGY